MNENEKLPEKIRGVFLRVFFRTAEQIITSKGAESMTFIRCDDDCRYQQEGVCTLDTVTAKDISADERCEFFAKR